MLLRGHFIAICFVDQTAPDKEAENAPPGYCLNLAKSGIVKAR